MRRVVTAGTEERNLFMTKKVEIETSARHIHLTQADVETLFGKGYQLTVRKNLSQPGQYACNEKLTMAGEKKEIAGVSVSTHMMPLKFLIGYLKRLTGCSCALIGVQPACCEPAASPSPEVERAVASLAEEFRAAFGRIAAGKK